MLETYKAVPDDDTDMTPSRDSGSAPTDGRRRRLLRAAGGAALAALAGCVGDDGSAATTTTDATETTSRLTAVAANVASTP